MPEDKKPPEPTVAETGKETLRTVISALIIALVIRTFMFEPFNIPSSSMVPTLLVGDFLFVSKFSYGYGAAGTFLGFFLSKAACSKTLSVTNRNAAMSSCSNCRETLRSITSNA